MLYNEKTDFAPNAPTDERSPGDWRTRYPKEARKKILIEAIYLCFLLFIVPVLLVLLKKNYIFDFLIFPSFKKYAYAWLGGTFGGVLFVLKWLYHSVAKNIWNEDRRLWRIFTPHLSASLAFAFIVLISSGIMNIFDLDSLNSPSTLFSFSFLVGYFSDYAIGKLTEVAKTLFGVTRQHSEDRTHK